MNFTEQITNTDRLTIFDDSNVDRGGAGNGWSTHLVILVTVMKAAAGRSSWMTPMCTSGPRLFHASETHHTEMWDYDKTAAVVMVVIQLTGGDQPRSGHSPVCDHRPGRDQWPPLATCCLYHTTLGSTTTLCWFASSMNTSGFYFKYFINHSETVSLTIDKNTLNTEKLDQIVQKDTIWCWL